MTATPPEYFERVCASASQRWDQLEADPELAGPWHQLFKQVQSPRHVLSELLQNADDAEATEASVTVDDGALVFRHNGTDFTEEQFASLCRFGYSNKRVLHTIGFRGIGFKSTFSLGPRVQLHTPTLNVEFDGGRFTQPVWSGAPREDAATVVRVPISGSHRQVELEKNLEEWAKSPVSLLFFRNLRRLRIQGVDLDWVEVGVGPVADSCWMALASNPEERFLLIRSAEEPFPEEALEEIRQERMLGADEKNDLPPCHLEIVLGAKGRLYVVLPTGVETPLPFACNAPFVQDPARLKIKDPETSPTNRWLLERVGRLAAAALVQWIGDVDVEPADRARAYDLLPDVDRDASSLEGACAAIAELAFADHVDGAAYLLTDSGAVTEADGCIAIPPRLLDVWPAEQAAVLLDDQARPPLSRHVSSGSRQKLLSWGVLDEISKSAFLTVLQRKHLPKPAAWRQLLSLWAYVAPEMNGYQLYGRQTAVRIVPVQGREVLYAAKDVVRLGEKRLLNSDDDWEFLSDHLLVLNQNWPRFLTERRRTGEGEESGVAKRAEAALSVLRRIGLEETSDTGKVIDQVAASFFSKEGTKSIADCVRLAHIAARLGAPAGSSFRFITRDRHIRAATHGVLYDADGDLDLILPEVWCSQHLLHEDYGRSPTACTADEWHRWASDRAGLRGFVPLEKTEKAIWGRDAIAQEIKSRGAKAGPQWRYVTHNFELVDWDFADALWKHWEALQQSDVHVWVKIVGRLIEEGEAHWAEGRSARALQIATTGSRAAVTHEPLSPRWLARLRDLPCLPDSHGKPRKPAELLRRTAATEPLLDVEPFVHRDLDTEASRSLLDLVGVKDTPTGPGSILEYLRSLATVPQPPTGEVEKWYRRLDQLVETVSTGDMHLIRRAFSEEKIILTEDGEWVTSRGAFQTADEDDAPGAAVVRSAVRDLALWRRVGVAERPTADLAIEWLRSLQLGEALGPEDLRRVRALLIRHPSRVWTECGRWLNLASELVDTAALRFGLSMQSLVAWSHLHEWVKRSTADLQRLAVEVVESDPFAQLEPLAAALEHHLRHPPAAESRPDQRPWLTRLGLELRRIRLADAMEAQRVRLLASELSVTTWLQASPLEVIPYLDGKPAGTPRRMEAVWSDRVLYVEPRPLAKLARSVAQELGRAFGRPDITDAIKICFERPPEFVSDYMEENFELLSQEELELSGPGPSSQDAEEPEGQGSAGPAEARPTEGRTGTGAPDDAVEDEAIAPDSKTEHHDGPDHIGAEDEEPSEDLDGEHATKRRTRSAPSRPPLIERFALAMGLRPDGGDRFFADEGSWIAKVHGTRFPWEHRSRSGELARYYWPKEHCLEIEPLHLDADVWDLVDAHPELYSLILTDPDGAPVEVSGFRLRELRDAGTLTLFPAAYRIVYGGSVRG